MTSITIEDLKLQAQIIKLELGIKHQQALNEASRRSGFHDYHHARKVILDKPHEIIFGMDSKYVLFDYSPERLKELGLSECYDYWEQCYSVAEKHLGDHIEYWAEENDWVALKAAPKNVKSIKDAVEFIRSIFFHPPFFVLFDGVIIDFSTYSSDDYVLFAPDNREQLLDTPEPINYKELDDYFLLFLQEDYQA
jgi:hypothetical protein